MKHVHITQQLLEASRSGRVPTSAVLELAALHLTSLCKACRQQALLARDLLTLEAGGAEGTEGSGGFPCAESGSPTPESPEPGTAVSEAETAEVTDAVLRKLRRGWEEERETAQAELQELLALPPEERLRAVRRARRRFRALHLAEILLDEARGAVSQGPEAVFDLARLAEEVASRARFLGRTLPQLRAEALALAQAWQGNARRLAADFRAAERHLARALETLREGEVVDPATQAEVYRLHAGFLVQVFDPGAEMIGIRAVQLSQIAQDWEGEARALLVLGLHHYRRGAFPEALSMAQAAAQVLPDDAPERLRLVTQHNLALFLAEVGRTDEARDHVDDLEPLFDSQPDAETRSRRLWLRLNLAKAEQRHEEVLELLQGLVEFYRERGKTYLEALTELELAAVCAELDQPLQARGWAWRAFEILRDLLDSETAYRALAILSAELEARRMDPETLRVLREAFAQHPRPPEEGDAME